MKLLMENWRKYLTEVKTSRYLKNDKDAYQILANLTNEEVPLDIEQGELKKLYKQLVHQLHPDKSPDDPGAAAKFLQFIEAYKYLSKKIAGVPHSFKYFKDDSKRAGIGWPVAKPPYKKETGTAKPTKGTTSQKPPPTGPTGRGEWTTAHTSDPYTHKKDRSKPPPRQGQSTPPGGRYRKLNRGESFVQYMESFGPEGKDILESIKKIYVILKEAQEKGKNARLSRWFRANEYRVHVRGIYQGPDAREGFQIEKKDWDNFARFMKLPKWNMIRTTLEKNIPLLQDHMQTTYMRRFMRKIGLKPGFINAGSFDYDKAPWNKFSGDQGIDGITSLTMARDRDAVLAIMKYISRIWHYKRSQYGE